MRSRYSRSALLVVTGIFVAAMVGTPGAHAASTAKKCHGKTATLASSAKKGTKKADVWVGTAGNNTFNGMGGADTMCGLGGADTLLGGGGGDLIDGGAGDDGGSTCAGPGVLNGGGGKDNILGGGGNNCMLGGGGNDTLTGGPADDVLNGGTGSDTMDGKASGNPLANPPTGLGDTASFSANPAAVDANLTTGSATSGSDTDGMTNIENLFGSPFDDTLKGNANAGATPNGLEGALGDDIIDGNGGFVMIAAYVQSPAAVTVTLTQPGTTGGLKGTASGGEGNDTLDNLAGVAGSQLDDTLTAGGVVLGQAGNDNITLVAGSIVDAGTGDDTVNAAPGVNAIDQIAGGDGNDTINSGGGDDQIDAGAGNDSVNAGDGNDSVLGGLGDDTLDGGAQTTFDAGSCGDGTDSGTGFEVDAVTQQPLPPPGKPADCES